MLFEPLKIDSAEVRVAAMRELDPGGQFFGYNHTLERFKTPFFEPFLSDWRIYGNWALAGSSDVTTRSTEIWQYVLQEFEPPPIDPAITEALDRYITKRKETLGNDEPILEPSAL